MKMTTSKVTCEMDTTPVQGRVAGFIIISWILIRWSMSVSEMPQCISNQNKPGTAQQVPHGKHKPSLITAVSVGYRREALCLFSFFFLLFSAELQRAPLKWLHLVRSSFHKPKATKNKKICTEVKTVAEITSSHIENTEKITLMDFGVSLVVVSLQMISNLWLQVSLQARAFICSIKQYFSRNNIVLSDSLHLWALSSWCMVICSIIKWSIQRKLAAYNKTPHFNSSVPSVSSFAK